MTRPVVTIDASDESVFEQKCARLVEQGYKLVSAECAMINSEQYDFCSSWMAIFALPEAMA